MKNKLYHFPIFLAIVAVTFSIFILFKTADYSDKIKKLDKIILNDLRKYGIEDADLIHRSLQRRPVGRIRKIYYLVKEFNAPSSFPIKNYERELKKVLSGSGYEISQAQVKKGYNELVLGLIIKFKQYDIYSLILHKKITAPSPLISAKPFVYPEGSGKVAIVLDDWGYNLKDLGILWEINRPITLAVLPTAYTKLKFSSQIAKNAAGKKYEVILHLPLEPKEYQGKDNTGFITTVMKKEEVIKVLNSSLDTVPYARGISNHEGSKATEDYTLMKTIFEQMRKRHLYYLDSLTSDSSLGQALAQELKLKFAKRDIFLDNQEGKEYIKNQLRQLAVLALKRNQAVGIGHDRINTLEAIKEMVPELEKAGIKFVFLSELVE